MKNKLISSISRGKQLKIKLLDKNDRFNYVNYFGFRDTYDLFLNTPLNISMFVPAIKVGDKWEVLEEPHEFEADIVEIEQYQTAKDNVIFEGKEIVAGIWEFYEGHTIQNLIKHKYTLTIKGLEVSGLNK